MADRRRDTLFQPGQSVPFISAVLQRAPYDEDERLRARIQELQLQEIVLRRELRKRFAHLRPKPIRPNMIGDRPATLAERLYGLDQAEGEEQCRNEQGEEDVPEVRSKDDDGDSGEDSSESEYWDARSHQEQEQEQEEEEEEEESDISQGTDDNEPVEAGSERREI